MDLADDTGTRARFGEYAADLASVLGHADRVRPFEDYALDCWRRRIARASSRWRR